MLVEEGVKNVTLNLKLSPIGDDYEAKSMHDNSELIFCQSSKLAKAGGVVCRKHRRIPVFRLFKHTDEESRQQGASLCCLRFQRHLNAAALVAKGYKLNRTVGSVD